MENKNLPRDVFLYLLAVIALAMAAVNFGALLFQFINISLPDVVTDRYASPFAHYGAIRWAVSTLVVVFPVLVWTWHFLKRDISANPEKRDLKIRKWLLYLTLFIAGVVVIGDLVTLVYNFLNGELTTRFLLKILTVLGIAGSVFFYYLNELKGRTSRGFSYAMIGIVAVGVIAGFAVAGSPSAQRVNKFDQQRVQDLNMIQGQIINYWQSKQKLPESVDVLRNDITGFVAPTDPQTHTSYEYRTTSALSFELCAVFQAATSDDRSQPQQPMYYNGIESTWPHGAGRTCFDRTIDPDFFQPVGKPIR